MISHEYRAIFVHVPKAAGTSIEAALGHYGEQGMVRGIQDHRTLRQLQWPGGGLRQLSSLDDLAECARALKARVRPAEHPQNRRAVTRAQYAGYTKFAVVRNPWGRAYSWYRNVLNDPLHRATLQVPEGVSFAEFVGTQVGRGLLRAQPYWLIDFAGRIGVDVVCRFESIEVDFAAVCERLGVPAVALPLLNPGDDHDYLARYDDRSRAIVAERYRAEIELFGYTFER